MKKQSAARENTAPIGTRTDDARLLQAARDARLESGGNFETLFRSVAAINGALEVLSQMVRHTDNPPDDLNWGAVGNLLDDARRRIGPVYSATNELSRYERAADGKAAERAK